MFSGSGRNISQAFSFSLSVEEGMFKDFEVSLSITGSEVTEVVKKCCGGRTPGLNKICPDFLKTLDVVWLMKGLCNIILDSGGSMWVLSWLWNTGPVLHLN